MSKTCARCEKTVYPIEELKCLDKVRKERLDHYRRDAEGSAKAHPGGTRIPFPISERSAALREEALPFGSIE